MLSLALCTLGTGVSAHGGEKTYAQLPSETPANFAPVTENFDYVRREVDIAMRDGVRLHTVLLVPRGAKHAGMLLTRTPYGADDMSHRSDSPHLAMALRGYDNPADIIVQDGYIRVVQDIRGKHGSEGDFVMNRAPVGPQNPTPVDESSDIYDTVDWLSKNVPESNGKVGIIGISYDGFEALIATIRPHPALKVAVPINPMVDGWMGDDWFHQGAFRQQMLPYIYGMVASRGGKYGWASGYRDDYDLYLKGGSAGDIARAHGMEPLGFWQKILAHPSYDAFWRDQALDKLVAREPLTVPTMLVHSLWDQEDNYGDMAAYRALAPKDPKHDKLYLVIGPWRHAKTWEPAGAIGAIDLGSDTGTTFRQDILRPFLARYLKDGAAAIDIAPVNAFVTGENRWRKLTRWPSGCAAGCKPAMQDWYVDADGSLSSTKPTEGFDEYVSDPAKPVPYRVRPIQSWSHGVPDQVESWPEWLVDDQRQFATRTDVLTYTSAPLAAPLSLAGEPVVRLLASTSGSDSDWVVKLIDVYPDEVVDHPAMGGYQLPIAMEIFRGRYREGFDKPASLTPDTALPYRFPLPTVNHVFLPGHRVMVQIQSSWFPLYDRNPQTYVPNIFLARPGDYRKATQRIYRGSSQGTFVELPVVNVEH
ncbi:CocE/NonD family hydrolase [Luteibacter rhizovicinus]|uniref:CocE/NonD family hydrolase n=1 Tax=Luteibacter rhizovicinus TaxID=242606 RepID=UPI003D189C00